MLSTQLLIVTLWLLYDNNYNYIQNYAGSSQYAVKKPDPGEYSLCVFYIKFKYRQIMVLEVRIVGG